MLAAALSALAWVASCGGGGYGGGGGGGGGMGGGGNGPLITGQPMSTAVTAPAPGSFTVTAVAATGYGTNSSLAYQWMRNNGMGGAMANISGANSATYTTPATSMSDNGAMFAVQVTDAYGHVTSNKATLTVM